jgi:hypothetical protein
MFLFDHPGSNDRLRAGGDQGERVRGQASGIRGQWDGRREIRGHPPSRGIRRDMGGSGRRFLRHLRHCDWIWGDPWGQMSSAFALRDLHRRQGFGARDGGQVGAQVGVTRGGRHQGSEGRRLGEAGPRGRDRRYVGWPIYPGTGSWATNRSPQRPRPLKNFTVELWAALQTASMY